MEKINQKLKAAQEKYLKNQVKPRIFRFFLRKL